MYRVVVGLAMWGWMALPVVGQTEKQAPIKLVVQAAGEPMPALKYLLMPSLADQEPGNAALLYMRAGNPEYNRRSADRGRLFFEWLDVPLADLPRKKVAELLPTLMLEEIDQAARREYCDWELAARLRKSGLQTPLPELGMMRDFSTLVDFRTRLDLAEGRIEKAINSLQTGFSMAHQLGEAPTLVNFLTGLSIENRMLSLIEDLIQQPGAPNLFWAIVHLPKPLVDMRRGLEGAKFTLDVQFPEIMKIDKGPLTAPELASLTKSCASVFQRGTGTNASFEDKLTLLGEVLRRYPSARQEAIDQGGNAEEIARLPMLQVVLRQNYKVFRQYEDDVRKWAPLPFWQSYQHLMRIKDAINSSRDAYPFSVFIPAIQNVAKAQARIERRVAALACIEAVRMHAAKTGKLPASLTEVADLPIPNDPLTGKSFQYHADGRTFTLVGPRPSYLPATQDWAFLQLEVTVKN